MKFKNKMFSGFIVVLFSMPVFADMFTPSPSCSKPIKPFQFDSQWEIDNFNNDVQRYKRYKRYKRCINDFVEEQNTAVNTHQQAANHAIDEWNRFVNYELN